MEKELYETLSVSKYTYEIEYLSSKLNGSLKVAREDNIVAKSEIIYDCGYFYIHDEKIRKVSETTLLLKNKKCINPQHVLSYTLTDTETAEVKIYRVYKYVPGWFRMKKVFVEWNIVINSETLNCTKVYKDLPSRIKIFE